MPRRSLLLLPILALPLVGGLCADRQDLPGLSAPVSVVTDAFGVRHVSAENDLDLARAAGVIHARDRFFQMDLTRREASGDLAELVGSSALNGDIQNRTIGLRRAAARSLALLSADELAVLEAYAEGVNHVLANEPLPPEYAALELSEARPWEVVDSLVIGKAIAASLSLDIDIFLTLDLQEFVAAGIANGFDGQTLFSEDLVRSAPMDPASTVPDATGTTPYLAKATPLDAEMLARAAEAAERVKTKLAAAKSELLDPVMERRETQVGSNEWGVAAEHSKSGRPMIANDPHLSLNMPSTFYEWHLQVSDDPLRGPMNVSGVGFPGTPGVILGQNEHITWGATTNPMDVSDVFQDELHVFAPQCAAIGALACIRSDGTFHPVEIEFPTYRFNLIGDGIQDNLQTATLPLEQSVIATVPFRSFGPILDIANPAVLTPPGGVTTALVLQYVGFHGTRELLTFQKWNRAQNLADFQDGLADYDVGSQNWAYADLDGNLAYFSSGELPLRKDLEQGSVHGGVPPFLIRDGSGPANWVPDPARSQGQTIPYDVMPMAEMPQTVNPANGFFVNANNDPAGTTLDNNPLNQVRPSKPTALYYLNPGYADGLRAGRITRLLEGEIGAGKKISLSDMQRFQMNTQMLDAELVVPFLLEAFDNASAPGAPPELAALAADPAVAEAIDRIGDWDFSSPTGLPEGYDAKDLFGFRNSNVSAFEEQMSVASTLWNVWRGQAVRSVIDARLSSLGAPDVGARDAYKALYHLLSQSPYTGVGASGVDFIPEPAALDAEQRRDLALLSAMRDALDLLAGPSFANAFGGSTNQADYRWGRLHRITFDHPIDASLSVPPQNGFEDLAPGLRGVSRDGGYEIVNASGFSARASNENAFTFGGGPVRRYTGGPEGFGPHEVIVGFNVIPGGPSGIPGDPGYTTQLGWWLTGETHFVTMHGALPALGSRKLILEP